MPFDPILKRWIGLNERTARDVPWWYNERASLSVFAGAVWRASGYAFEEFVENKAVDDANESSQASRYRGRVDIHLTLKNGREFVAEAKMTWSSASFGSNPEKKIAKRLTSACADVRHAPAPEATRIAILFVAPYVKTTDRYDIDQHLKRWLERISTIECDASAWIFPGAQPFTKFGDHYYPGAMVLIKQV
jgi:hypothetical protein